MAPEPYSKPLIIWKTEKILKKKKSPHRRTNKLSPPSALFEDSTANRPSAGGLAPIPLPTLAFQSLMAPLSGRNGGMALCPQRGGDETYGRATDAARSALFFFIYNLLFILILLLTKFIVCRPPTPPPPWHKLRPSPPPTHVHTNVTCRISLWQEELSHRCVYFCSSSLTDRCICVSSERVLPELCGSCVRTATR